MGYTPTPELFADLAPSHWPADLSRQIRRDRDGPLVQILLALYDGENSVEAQLQSFVSQTHENWELLVSDDGSADLGVEKVWDFALTERDRDIRLIEGEGRGSAANFLSLVAAADSHCPFTAFSSQKDVWMPQKLARAIEKIENLQAEKGVQTPILYCSRVVQCDSHLGQQQISPALRVAPGFSNALAENICYTGTIMLNRPALELVKRSIIYAVDVPYIEWWMYLLISGAGGIIYFDEMAGLYARGEREEIAFHPGSAPFERAYRAHNSEHIASLRSCHELLTSEACAQMEMLDTAREGKAFKRLWRLMRSGVHRQSRQESLKLFYASWRGLI